MKRFLAGLLTCILLLASAACSGSGEQEISAPSGASSAVAATEAAGAGGVSDKKMTLSIWTSPDWKGVYYGQDDGDSYTDFLESAYPIS